MQRVGQRKASVTSLVEGRSVLSSHGAENQRNPVQRGQPTLQGKSTVTAGKRQHSVVGQERLLR